MLKSTILGNVLGKNYKPSNEDNVQTTPVGSSGDAVVEIERLKSENLDLMEIHALEQDLALIEAEGEVADELGEATSEITEIKAEIESYYEKGGMSATDAHHIDKRLGYINRRLGGHLNLNIPATESFRGNDADRMTLTASVEASAIDKIKELWKSFVNMLKKAFEKIKDFFGFGKKKAEDVTKKLKDIVDKYKNKDGKGTLTTTSGFIISALGLAKPEDAVSKDEGETSPAKEDIGGKLSDGVVKIAETTINYFKMVDYKKQVGAVNTFIDGVVSTTNTNDSSSTDVKKSMMQIMMSVGKTITGKDIPATALSEGFSAKSESMVGGYVTTLTVLKAEAGADVEKQYAGVSVGIESVVPKDSKIKKIKVTEVPYKDFAKSVEKLAELTTMFVKYFEDGDKAIDEYASKIEETNKVVEAITDESKKSGFKNVIAMVKFTNKLFKDHPSKNISVKSLDAANAYATAISG